MNQQSGLFAGDGGYHVKADHVDLQGGAIASTASKENNDLTANSLTFSNIENESSYQATTVALSGGTRFGEETGTDSTGQTYTNNVNWRDSTTFSPSLPQQDKDSDSSTTYATMSAGNINIGGKDTTVQELGIHSDINTANQKVDEISDLQAILDKQKLVADATSTIVAATRTYSQNKQAEAEAQKQAAEAQAIEKLQAEGGADWEKYNSTDDYVTKQNLLKNALPAYKEASDQAQAWGMGGSSSRALNAVTTAITAALGGQTDLQVVTNTLAPYAAQVIGQEFGHGEDKNTAAQLVSHAILGATLAYINGGDPTAGGSAAVASEAAANYLTNQLAEKYKDDPKYFVNGEFQANLLSETEKAQIRDLTAGIGAVIGGAVGDSSYNAQLAGVIGQNAVENNAVYKINEKGEFITCFEILGLSCAPRLGEHIATNNEILGGFGSLVLDVLPSGKGLKIIDKVTGSLVGSFSDLKTAKKAVQNYCSGTACFTAGTLIETDQGLKEIEQFEGGELIWSRNDVTLEYGYRPVIATKVTAEQAIFEVVIQSKIGHTETLETTAEHPFWIKDYGWLKASLLQSGMTLLDRNNEELTIISQVLIPHKVETVYNIEVEGFHTYHVGELGTWVHNANCCEVANTFEKKLYNLLPGERVALIKTEAKTAAESLGLVKDSRLTKINGREVYKGKDGNYYALDTQHGRWEVTNKKGQHQGEVTLHTLTPKGKQDSSGGHNLIVK
ncbi:MAG: polymorphic toxin-type HINT domain-containing protein [Acinetobacter gandensis]|uniref:polymorphic toxin-type HINT domain-containing protein n=1 Tax=Acinetobacter gandensis TaxID=1443941 RepID=UPI003D016DC9